MMPLDALTRDLHRLAPVAVLGVFLYILARKVGWTRVAALIARGGVGLVAVVVLVGGARTLHEDDVLPFVGAWLAVGFPVFLFTRWQATADDRKARRQRLDQARGHERKRAPMPLPSASRGSTGSGTSPTPPGRTQ